MRNIYAKKLTDKSFVRFMIVGTLNTAVGAAIMFTSYNIFCLSYWVSGALCYILTSFLSYYLNKRFTFKNTSFSIGQVCRFALTVIISYIIAYGLAKPAAEYVLSFLDKRLQANAAMLAGMCIFTVLNYIGQRFFTFRRKKNRRNNAQNDNNY